MKSALSVVRSYPEPNREKLTLIFDAPYAGNYRLTFAINKAVKNYVNKTGAFQYELTYDDVVLAFDWSDCAHISGLQFNHGVLDNLFWFRIRRDNVPQGIHIEIDPTTTSYYPSNYVLGGSTTYVSGTLNDLQTDNGVYMQFRSYLTKKNNLEDFVDQQSNVDSSIDKGTHNVFGSLQAKDTVYDVMTEANTDGSSTFGASTGASYTTVAANQMYGSVFTSPADSQGASIQNIIWYGRTGSGTGDAKAVLILHSTMVIVAVSNVVAVTTTAQERTCTFSSPPTISANTQYVLMMIFSASTRFYYGAGTTSQGHLDTTNSYATPTNPTDATHNNNQYRIRATYTKINYVLDLEVQWVAADFDEAYEKLCIYAGSLGAESLKVQYRSGSSWLDLIASLSPNAWNNVTVSLSSATYTIRFIGTTETADTAQDTWSIDAVLLHTWSDSYVSEVEFTGKSNAYSWYWVDWLVDNCWTQAGVGVTLQLYDWVLGAYPSSGDGYLSYVSGAANVDQTYGQNVTVSTDRFREAGTSNWKVRVRGELVGASQFDFKADLVVLSLSYSNSPSTVGTSTQSESTVYPFQRKGFYAASLFWVFYSDGTNCVYRTSSDGSIWSNATTVIAGSNRGYFFSLCFDGTYIHYSDAEISDIRYRRGTPNSDGTITWSAVEQTVVVPNDAQYPTIAVDSSGYAWIGYNQKNGLIYYPSITKNANNNGTWSTSAGFPYDFSATSSSTWSVTIVPLASNKMYAVYTRNGVAGLGKLWNGTAFGDEETTMSDNNNGLSYSVVANGDDVHLVFHEDTNRDIYYNKRTYGVGWGVESVIQVMSLTRGPALSLDPITGDLYCFWGLEPTADHIYYKKCVSGTWDADPTDWIDETTDDLAGAGRQTCFYQKYGSYIGLVYMTKKATPWNIRFNFLEVHYTYTKTASQSISVAAQNARAIEVTRPTTQAILISTAATKIIDVLKSASQAIGFAFSSAKMKEAFRTASQTISTAFGVSKLTEAARAAAQTITISATTTRLIELTKTISQTISTSLAANRLAELTRQVSQAIGVSTIVGKLGEYSRNVSQGIAAAFGVGKLAELSKSVTQAIGVSASSQRLAEFIKSATQTITFSLDGERLAELYRAISQGITFSATSQRLAEFIKSATQTITFSLDGERLAEINRAASQFINLAFVVSKLSEFFRAASQQISTAFGVNKIFEAIRAAAQKITISTATISVLEIGRVASLTINMGLNTVVTKIMSVFISLQLTVKTWGLVTNPDFNGIPLIALIVFGLMIYIGLTLGKRH